MFGLAQTSPDNDFTKIVTATLNKSPNHSVNLNQL